MALGDLRYKGILFGDDCWGTVIHEESPYKNTNGIEMKRYLIIPGPDLVEMYPEHLKKPGVLNVKTPRGAGIWVEYPTFFIVDENPSRTNAIARIDCGFDGRDTAITRRRKKQTQQIQELMEENETLRIGNIVLNEENGELLNDKLALAKKLAELGETMRGRRMEVQEDVSSEGGM